MSFCQHKLLIFLELKLESWESSWSGQGDTQFLNRLLPHLIWPFCSLKLSFKCSAERCQNKACRPSSKFSWWSLSHFLPKFSYHVKNWNNWQNYRFKISNQQYKKNKYFFWLNGSLSFENWSFLSSIIWTLVQPLADQLGLPRWGRLLKKSKYCFSQCYRN